MTGLGGIFFKSKDSEKIKNWYGKHLGLVMNDYGKFAHILDPEGNKIELWEPVDKVFTKMYKGKTNF